MSSTYNLQPVDIISIGIGATGVMKRKPLKLHQVTPLQIGVVGAAN